MSRQASWQDRQRAAHLCIHHSKSTTAEIVFYQDGVEVERKRSPVCYPCLLYARDYHATVYPLKRKEA